MVVGFRAESEMRCNCNGSGNAGSRPLACFAGIWTNWTSVRKVKEGRGNGL